MDALEYAAIFGLLCIIYFELRAIRLELKKK